MELKEYRIKANDGKTLMSFYSYVEETLSEELTEHVSKCIQLLCSEAVEEYGKSMLALYEKNGDRNKRIHTLTVRCEITASAMLAENGPAAKLGIVFRKGANTLFAFEQRVCYEPKWKLLYIG